MPYALSFRKQRAYRLAVGERPVKRVVDAILQRQLAGLTRILFSVVEPPSKSVFVAAAAPQD